MAENLPMEQKEITYDLADGTEMRLSMNMVRRFLVQGESDLVTTTEMITYMHLCRARKIDPFLRQCWLIKYSKQEPAQIIESIHFKRRRAMEHPLCQGWMCGIVVIDKKGNPQRRSGICLPGDTLVGGFFNCRPRGWEVDYDLEVPLEPEIKKTKKGGITAFWSAPKQPMMIMKVAESRGLTAMFDNQSAATYIPEEMQPLSDEPIDITPGQDEPTPEREAPDPALVAKFDRKISGVIKGNSPEEQDTFMVGLEKYLGVIVSNDANDFDTVDRLKAVAANDFDNFMNAFDRYQEAQEKADGGTD